MARGLVRRESVDTEMHKSEDRGKTFVYTKKRGYDVTRNPHLNKVSAGAHLRDIFCSFLRTGAEKVAAAFRGCGTF